MGDAAKGHAEQMLAARLRSRQSQCANFLASDLHGSTRINTSTSFTAELAEAKKLKYSAYSAISAVKIFDLFKIRADPRESEEKKLKLRAGIAPASDLFQAFAAGLLEQ